VHDGIKPASTPFLHDSEEGGGGLGNNLKPWLDSRKGSRRRFDTAFVRALLDDPNREQHVVKGLINAFSYANFCSYRRKMHLHAILL